MLSAIIKAISLTMKLTYFQLILQKGLTHHKSNSLDLGSDSHGLKILGGVTLRNGNHSCDIF